MKKPSGNGEGRRALSPEEFGNAIGFSHWSVRNWVKDKKIASVRVQGKIKIPVEELDKVLKGSLAPSTAA